MQKALTPAAYGPGKSHKNYMLYNYVCVWLCVLDLQTSEEN